MTRDPQFSRRSFLKGASFAAAGTAVGERLLPPELAVHRVQGVRTIPTEGAELSLKVNGETVSLMAEPRTTLLEALRNGLDMTGSKEVCDRGACGACTVLLDGEPVNSCMTLAFDAEGAEVTTIEGIGTADNLHPVQRAFIDSDALQCGFCTPGFVMSSVALLGRNPKPSRTEIQQAISGNICRCGTYTRIVEAVESAANGGGR